MAQEWYYEKDGGQHGPITSKQLKELAASGDLRQTDLVWKDGMAEGKPAKSVKGLFPAKTPRSVPPPAVPAIPAPPPVPAQSTSTGAGSSPALWNPKALGAWSLFFTWGFGAFLLAHNWRALGNKGRARRCMIWFYGVWPFFAFLTLCISGLIVDTLWMPGVVMIFIAWGILGVWALIEMRPQIAYIHDHLGDSFSHKPWGKPIGVWTICVVIFCAAGSCISYPYLKEGHEAVKQIEETNRKMREAEDKHFDERMRKIVGFGYDKSLTKLTFKGNYLFFKSPVTEPEANRLGRFLVRRGSFNDSRSVEVKIIKPGATYEYWMKIKPGAEAEQEFIEYCEALSDELSESVFGDAPVNIHLCNDSCDTILVVNPHRN